jgi:hypothetical protein
MKLGVFTPVYEGLRAAVNMLSRVVLTEPPVNAWWA